jgi:Flp pilus assembly protein TadG
MLPWILFLFAGAYDWGFYSYALISVQNAARVAVEYAAASATSSSDSATACQYVLAELRGEPNVGTSVTTCDALPVILSVSIISGPDGSPAAEVSVTYQTVRLIPIPGLLAGQVTLTRTALMRING